MSVRMESVLIADVLGILLQNDGFLDKYGEFQSGLGIEPSAYSTLLRSFLSGVNGTNGYRVLFTGILQEWSRQGKQATIGKLCNVLRGLNSVDLAEILEDAYIGTEVVVKNHPFSVAQKIPSATSKNIFAPVAVPNNNFGIGSQPLPIPSFMKSNEDVPDNNSGVNGEGCGFSKLLPKKQYPPGKRFALICNITYDREGTEADAYDLDDVLRKSSCETTVLSEEQRTKEKLLKEVQKFINMVIDYGSSRVGGIFIAIMSHGNNRDEFQTQDGQLIPIRDIIDMFSQEKCFYLRKVPKVFLVNMCRGSKYQLHEDSIDLFDWEKYIKQNFKPAQVSLETDDVLSDEIGDDEDTWRHVYIALSTLEGDYLNNVKYTYGHSRKQDKLLGIGHVSYRQGRAWFVEDFCKVLQEKIDGKDPTDIDKIFKKTKELVEKRGGRKTRDPIHFSRKQTPILIPISFTRELRFPPPLSS